MATAQEAYEAIQKQMAYENSIQDTVTTLRKAKNLETQQRLNAIFVERAQQQRQLENLRKANAAKSAKRLGNEEKA